MSSDTLVVLVGCFVLAGCDPGSSSDAGSASGDMVVADAALEMATPDMAATDMAVGDHGTLPDEGSADSAQPPDLSIPDGLSLKPDSAVPLLSGCVKGAFSPFFGNLHSHTSYSDGKKTPKDAFKHARDVAKLDILVVTDHLEQLYIPVPLDRYGKCKSQAAAELKAGSFVAACGFEYGSAFTPQFTSSGHANVFFSPKLLPAIQLDFHAFYKSLAACKTCVGQINHPGSEKDQHFNNFEYDKNADARLNLFEFNSTPAWALFFKALDAGWHLSPVYNQDNHSADWGTKNNNRSGLLMAALDMQSMGQAMRDRRTFMTTDKNANIIMKAGNCWMGSVLKGVASLTLTVKAADKDSADSFSSIELYGKGQKKLATAGCKGANPCSMTFSVTAKQSPYFVARAKQTDGDLLVAAPIWLAP